MLSEVNSFSSNSPAESFKQAIDKALYDNQFNKAFQYFKENQDECIKEQKQVTTLLNYLSSYSFIEELNECFKILLQKGYIFESPDYI